tara:strand:- start:1472 stop:4567 length:3096 start_codon:yes stop_codon:yes gene_type:complete
MPFVPSVKGEIYGLRQGLLPTEPADPIADLSFGEVTSAAFRQENIFGALSSKVVGQPDTKDNPDFDAYSFFTDAEKLNENFVMSAIYADDESEIEAVRSQMAMEIKDRQTIQQAGALGGVMTMVAGIASPLTFLSVGGVALNTYRTGKSILSGAAVTSAVVGVDTAIEEAALHSQQLTRTFGESSINVGAGVFLGGILGGGAASLSKYGIDQQQIAELEDVLNVEPKIAAGINPAINAETAPIGESIGAAKTFGDQQVKGKFAKFVTKKLGFDPLSRTITSDNPFTRQIAVRLAENPIEMDGQVLQAAESLAQLHSGKYATALQENAQFFNAYKKGKGKLNKREFNKAIATAIRKGDSDIPEIKAASDMWRKELYDPLKNEMVAQKLLPEDVDVATANNYLNRVWDKDKITANRPEFVTKVSNWLADKDTKLFDESQSILDDLAGDSVEVKLANLKKQIDKASGKEKIRLEKQQTLINKAEFKNRLDMEDQDYRQIAGEIATRIQGSPDGRLPYDWKLGDGKKEGINSKGIAGTSLRGPLRNRVFQIDDELIEEFLENDIEVLGARYVQNIAGDLELMRAFDDVNMDRQIKEIRDWWDKELDNPNLTLKQSKKMTKQKEQDEIDIAGMRDRIRGVYGFQADNIWSRMGRSARDLNYLRLLGGVTISSLPDVARVVMAEGFVNTFSKGLIPLISNSKTTKLAQEELRRYDVGTDVLKSGKSEIIADVADYAQGGTIVERGLRAGVNQFGKFNLLDYWTAGMKQLHAVTMQTSIFDSLSKGKYDKRLARLGIDEETSKRMWQQVKKHGSKTDGIWLTNAKNWDEPNLEVIWGAAVRKESDRVIIIPGQEKPLFMSSEMGKTIGQFRSFIFSATQRIVIPAIQRQDQNTLGGVASLIGMGIFSYYLKQKIAGRPISEDPRVWAMEGIERSGIAGIVGEIHTSVEKISGNSVGLRSLLGVNEFASKQVSRTISESLLGPTLGSLLSTTVAATNAITSSGEMTESDIRTLRRLIPLQNLFYLRFAFNEAEKAANDL